MYLCMYVNTVYACVCMYVRMYICICNVYVCVCMYACMCMHVCVCMYVCRYVYVCVCVSSMYVYVCMCVCMCSPSLSHTVNCNSGWIFEHLRLALHYLDSKQVKT